MFLDSQHHLAYKYRSNDIQYKVHLSLSILSSLISSHHHFDPMTQTLLLSTLIPQQPAQTYQLLFPF